MSQADAFRNAMHQQQFHNLAGSPLLLDIMSRLRIESIIDTHAPTGNRQDVSHGQAALALLLTRLLEPKALYKVADWLAGTGVDIVLSHEGAAFTDDTLGRMLDAVSEQTDAIWTDVLREVVSAYPQMAEAVIQYDLTSVYFEGEYTDSDLARYGYSRDHRSDAKQINLGVSTTGGSRLPLLYELLAGNTADNQTPMAHMQRLKTLMQQIGYPRQALVLVGDRAMLNRPLIRTYLQQQQLFVGPWTPPDIRDRMGAISQDELLASPLDYRPQSHREGDPAPYYGVMREHEFVNGDGADEVRATLRVLVLYSRNKARLDAGKRADHLAKLQTGLHDIQGKLNQRRYKSRCYVEERVRKLLARHSAARSLVDWSLTGEDGQLKLAFAVDEAAQDQAQQLDGRYALVTNSDLSANEMLTAFKRQSSVEGRFRVLKDDVAIRPIHLRRDNRIQALVLLTMIALVVYSVLEWRVRQHTPGRKRPWTGRAILEVFESLLVGLTRFADGSRLWHPPPLMTDNQALLWEALGLPPLSEWLNNNCGT
jgi:transposase